MRSLDAGEGANALTAKILEFANIGIGTKLVKESKSTHPWMTPEINECIAAKHAAQGGPDEERLTKVCSQKILETRNAYIVKTKAQLKSMKQSSKL